VIYQHVSLNAGASYKLDLVEAMRGIVYLMQGKLTVNEQTLAKDQAHFIEGYESLEFKASENAEFMVCMGVPHGEPIKQYGPFVD